MERYKKINELKFMNEAVFKFIEEVFAEIAKCEVYGHICHVQRIEDDEDDEIRAEMKLIVPHANMDEEVWDIIYGEIEECLKRNDIEEEVDDLFELDEIECEIRLPDDIYFRYVQLSIRAKNKEIEKILTQTTE